MDRRAGPPHDGAMTPPDAPSSPLAVPAFRAMWLATLVANFGYMIQSVGASWMMMALDGSAQMIALVQTAMSLPIMLFSLWAGALADNRDRRGVMLAAQVAMLLVSLALALGAWLGLLAPWSLLAFTFLLGSAAAVNNPAWQASVGDMVPRALTARAVMLNGVSFNIARSFGPAIGGAIVATGGAAAAFAVNAASYVGLIAALARWRPEAAPRRLPPEPLGVAMGAGLRYVRMSPHLLVVLRRVLLFSFAAAAAQAVMPLVARDLIGGGAITYGVLLGGFGVGAVVGGLGAAHMRRLSADRAVQIASLAVAVGLAGTGVSGSLVLTLLFLAVLGAGWVVAWSTFNVGIQLASPRWVVARALALYQVAAFGGLAAGSWAFGALAERYGVSAALEMAAAMEVAGVLLGWRRPLPDPGGANFDPHDFREPEIALPIRPQSGPVVISIEHRVPRANVPAFLAAMAERRRIRLRDGARDWRLLRDLADPALWVERYQAPTWIDYLRHNERRTHADDVHLETIRALREPGYEPVVRRLIERQTGAAHDEES
jgi:predicted MFS family arabinose efflux permease